MVYTYNQTTGEFKSAIGEITKGYSGFGEGKNNPAMEGIADVGPIPVGSYECLTPINSKNLGPDSIALIASEDTNTFGRSAFYIHGDSVNHPGLASHGCIIIPPGTRKAIKKGDIINVISGITPISVNINDSIELKESVQ